MPQIPELQRSLSLPTYALHVAYYHLQLKTTSNFTVITKTRLSLIMICKCWNLGHIQMPQLHLLQRSLFPFNFPTSCRILSTSKRRTRAGRLHCSSKEVDNGRLEIGSTEWLAKATPLQVLGLQDTDNFTLTEEDIKAAFRAKVAILQFLIINCRCCMNFILHWTLGQNIIEYCLAILYR